jgi:tetratricopeptide (TPR) repeat protein
MRRQVEGERGKAEEYLMRFVQASAAAVGGRLRAARELAREGVDLALGRTLKQIAAQALVQLGVRETYARNTRLAKQDVAEALKLDRSPEGMIQAAPVLGLNGDAAGASALVEEAARKTPSTDTLFHAIALPVARGAIELGRGAADTALDALKPAGRYERGVFGTDGLYLRGQAHLRAGPAVEAAADFQKLIDAPGTGGRFWIPMTGPLARLGLARATALSGDVAKSRRAYQDFLALWKDADPDVPILIQAKAEYAKLAGP